MIVPGHQSQVVSNSFKHGCRYIVPQSLELITDTNWMHMSKPGTYRQNVFYKILNIYNYKIIFYINYLQQNSSFSLPFPPVMDYNFTLI